MDQSGWCFSKTGAQRDELRGLWLRSEQLIGRGIWWKECGRRIALARVSIREPEHLVEKHQARKFVNGEGNEATDQIDSPRVFQLDGM